MDNQSQDIIAEEQELQEILNRLNATPKMARWVNHFLDKTNPETFGNRTRSALMAYNLDEQTQYFSAGVIGSENFKKLKTIASEYLEKTGMTTGKQLELLTFKAVNTTNAKYLITLLEITGIYNPKAQTVIQNNTQINSIANVQISPEKAEQYRKEFTEFIEQKYKQPALDPASGSVGPD